MADKKTALIYIGQTPREDITPEMASYLKGISLLTETGVLDPFSEEEIRQMHPRGKDRSLITKLHTGQSVTVDEDIIHRRIAEKITELKNEGYDACAVMCTGNFPDLPDCIPVVTSDNAFHRDLDPGRDVHTLGILVPMEEQQERFAALYRKENRKILTGFASPYGPEDRIIDAALLLKEKGADCIFLDCMGYSGGVADKVSLRTGLPCFIPRREIAKQIIHLYQK